MHKEKIRFYNPKTRQWEVCEADTFDTVVHMNKGLKHALRDIERLAKEDEEAKGIS